MGRPATVCGGNLSGRHQRVETGGSTDQQQESADAEREKAQRLVNDEAT
jgi:hypothetical protein